MTTAEILPQLLKMSPNDQLVITDALIRSLRTRNAVSESEFKQELDRRVADADTHPEEMVPWDEAVRQLRGNRDARN